MFGNYEGFSDHFAIHVVIWGFLVASLIFIVLAGAFAKDDGTNN